MGKKNKNSDTVAKFAKLPAAKRMAGAFMPSTPDQRVLGVDSIGRPTCNFHLAGKVFFGCTCGVVYGELLLMPIGETSCGCRSQVKSGNYSDRCMILRQHDTVDLSCGTARWNPEFGDPAQWQQNYEAAVRIMWTARHSAMSLVEVTRLLGFGCESPFVQTMGVLLLFMGASQLVILPNSVCGNILHKTILQDDWQPGTTDAFRKALRPAYALRYRGFTHQMQLFQAFNLGRQLYPEAKVGFHWLLSHMSVRPDDVISFFRMTACVGHDALVEVSSRLKGAKVTVASAVTPVGETKFVLGADGKVRMDTVQRMKLYSGDIVYLMKRLPLPKDMGNHVIAHVQQSVQVVGYVRDSGGTRDVYRPLNYLDLSGV